MFRVQSAHHQEVNDANCTYATSGIVTLCKWPSCATAKEEFFLSGCTRRSLTEIDDTRGCICTICVVHLLMVGGLRSKHVEEFNFMQFMWMNKKFMYQVGNNKMFEDIFVTICKQYLTMSTYRWLDLKSHSLRLCHISISCDTTIWKNVGSKSPTGPASLLRVSGNSIVCSRSVARSAHSWMPGTNRQSKTNTKSLVSN